MEEEVNKTYKRPNWDEFWLTQALFYSTRGTCDRHRTAAVIVDKNNLLISAGYNGSPPGAPHCDDVGHLIIDGHCLRTLHAEENALLNAKRGLEGATAYMLYSPCLKCAKALISSGVKRIVYAREYSNMHGEDKGWKHFKELAAGASTAVEYLNLDFNKVLKNMLGILKSKGGALK